MHLPGLQELLFHIKFPEKAFSETPNSVSSSPKFHFPPETPKPSNAFSTTRNPKALSLQALNRKTVAASIST